MRIVVKYAAVFLAFTICVIIAGVFEHYGYDDALASMALMLALGAMADRAFGDS